jgi:hypothetical protein
MAQKWLFRWKYWLARTSVTGVWRLKTGGFYIRRRMTEPGTRRLREISQVLRSARTVREAGGALRSLVQRTQNPPAPEPTRHTFADYALSLLERRIRTGEISSAKTREVWGSTLQHHLLPTFGPMHLDQIRRADIEAWKDVVATKRIPRRARAKLRPNVKDKLYDPVTRNGWIKILRTILTEAVAEFELPRNPMLGVRDFDVTARPTYTEEEPNALTPEEVPAFLQEMRRRHPQHFAMVALGLVIGARPSSLRPLRRSGPTPDVLWDSGVLLLRRSHTRRQEIMAKTKTGRSQRITLPPEVLDLLRWHVRRLQGAMARSELLFPSVTGELRAASCLDKPFREVATALGLRKRITPRALRRTYQDLMRTAGVSDLVTRAVSGHATERMQHHYSSVGSEEMRSGLSRLIGKSGLRDLLALEPDEGATAARDAAVNESSVVEGHDDQAMGDPCGREDDRVAPQEPDGG